MRQIKKQHFKVKFWNYIICTIWHKIKSFKKFSRKQNITLTRVSNSKTILRSNTVRLHLREII